MIKKIIFTFVGLIVFAFPVLANQQNPIDINEKACQDKAVSTYDMLQCSSQAYSAWDLEMNHYYDLLAKTLNHTQKSALLSAQKNWLNFRDSNFALLDSTIGTKDGTIYPGVIVGEKKDIVKQRALELKQYYEIMSDKYFTQ